MRAALSHYEKLRNIIELREICGLAVSGHDQRILVYYLINAGITAIQVAAVSYVTHVEIEIEPKQTRAVNGDIAGPATRSESHMIRPSETGRFQFFHIFVWSI